MLDGPLCANSDDARKAVSLMLGPSSTARTGTSRVDAQNE